MTLVVFLSALAGAVFVLEVANRVLMRSRVSPLTVQLVDDGEQEQLGKWRQNTWYTILGTVFPQWFDPTKARQREAVIDLIRRAGYAPYDSVQAFYAATMASFAQWMILAALVAVLFFWLGLRILTPIVAVLFLWMGYRRPYSKLKQAAKRRAALMRPNMLAGLTVFESLLSAGVGVQQALRQTAQLGGPFCNLLALLVARLQVDEPEVALKRVRQHLPDPTDTDVVLFFRDLEDYFLRQRPLLESVKALLRSVHLSIVNDTVARASKVKRTAGLYGIFAILGMLISVLAPVFMGGGL